MFAMQHWKKYEARIDCFITDGPVILKLTNHNCARTAITFCATLFYTFMDRQLTQIIQHGRCRSECAGMIESNRGHTTIQYEGNFFLHESVYSSVLFMSFLNSDREEFRISSLSSCSNCFFRYSHVPSIITE